MVQAEASRIDGMEGDDVLTGDDLSNKIDGYGGNDSINGEADADRIDGGDGNDNLDGSFGSDTLFGGSGDDQLTDLQGSNLLDGGDGNDLLRSQTQTGSHTLIGGLGDDGLWATGQALYLNGGDGQDVVAADGWISGQGSVQAGTATVVGGAGSDRIFAGRFEKAILQGGDGDDTVDALSTKYSSLEGGAGSDTLIFTTGDGLWQIGVEPGTSSLLNGGSKDDVLLVYGHSGGSVGQTDFTLIGSTGNDLLKIECSVGAYTTASLSGGDGDDTLEVSSVLRLSLSGGSGQDRFVLTASQYRATLSSQNFITDNSGNFITVAGQPVTITNFQPGSGGDILDIRDLLLNAAIGYDGSNPFTTGHIDLVQVGSDTLLKVDSDGGANSFTTLASLTNVSLASLMATNISPLFGTPNDDVMTDLKGGTIHQGISGNDIMVGFAVTASQESSIKTLLPELLRTASRTSDNLQLDGGAGNDTLAGGSGNDQPISGSGTTSWMQALAQTR